MSNIIYGSLEINNKVYSFALSGHIIKIVQSASYLINDFSDIDCKDTICGVTSDSRDILFLKCTFHKNRFMCCDTISIEGYVLSTTNEVYNFSVDKINFYSDAINMFYQPKIAERLSKIDCSTGNIDFSTCGFKDSELSFFYQDIKCMFNIAQQINLKPEESNRIECNSYFSFEFPQTMKATEMIEYIQYIYDFLRLVNYSSNILFKKIILYLKDENKIYTEKAILHIFQEAKEYENNMRNSVQIYDFEKSKIQDVFGSTAALRKYDNKLQLYFPKDKSERYRIEPIKWFSKASIFEGLFSEIYPNFKSSKNEHFDIVKKQVINNIKSISDSLKNSEEKKYYNCFVSLNERYEGRLSEKFNYVFKENKSFLNEIIAKIEKDYGIVSGNFGDIYAKYRNKVAHGDIQPLTENEIAVYRIMEPLIYLMLFKKAGLSDDEKSGIINKLF